jgi:indolepyruvate ferredoxin oxidoreductase
MILPCVGAAIAGEARPGHGGVAKKSYGGWMIHALRLLARARVLRGTRFDPFGYMQERRTERGLITEYARMVERVTAVLNPTNYDLAVKLAEVPQMIRGYGHVKDRSLKRALEEQTTLIKKFEALATSGSFIPGITTGLDLKTQNMNVTA